MSKKGHSVVILEPDIHADTVIVDGLLALLNQVRAQGGLSPIERGDMRDCIIGLANDLGTAQAEAAMLRKRVVMIMAAAGGISVT